MLPHGGDKKEAFFVGKIPLSYVTTIKCKATFTGILAQKAGLCKRGGAKAAPVILLAP